MLSSTISNLILDLRPREREVIIGRFGLGKRGRETLAGIGDRYGLTRERVRQIEEVALSRLKEEMQRERLPEALNLISGHLNQMGGVRKEDLLLNDLHEILKDQNLHFWHLKFLEAIHEEPLHHLGDGNLHPFWYIDEEVVEVLKKFVNYLERLVAQRKEDLIAKSRFQDFLNEAVKAHRLPELIGLNYLSISRKFKTNPFGDFGLSEWEEINPKSIGSKAYVVIKKIGKPLHFKDVAKEINKVKFDKKKALPQTVHNELIKDDRFVLVGRGKYGLREQGYWPGRAQEVIAKILKQNGPMGLERLVEEVLKQRFLERNTIFLNIQNKKLFKRLPDGRYGLVR